jgi:hypothetical protein
MVGFGMTTAVSPSVQPGDLLMPHHRLPNPQTSSTLPALASSPSPSTFVVCPVILMQNLNVSQYLCQFAVYQLAYRQAEAEVRSSTRAHELLAVWN